MKTKVSLEKRTVVGLRLPESLNKKLAKRAGAIGISKNALISQILWDYISEKN